MRRVLGRAVRNRHRHAIEQASRRWRGGRRDDSARTRRKILISTQVAARTVGVVTLGAPHVPPPEGTPCATRGVLADVAGAAWPDVALITVASDAIRGDRGGDVEAATAADAYGRVSGNPEGLGDSVVPLSAAHLPEADLQLTLPCRHSINVAGTSVPTDDWYGAERWVDAWLGPALDVVSKPRWLRKLVRR